MKPYRLLDLFSGVGAFSLGLERSGGFETVAFCEIAERARRVLRKHWLKVPIYDDVRTLTAARLAADGIRIDAVCGGFPCQDVSAAGPGTGLAGERSGLWSEFERLIQELRPEVVIVENSPLLRSRGLTRILCGLAALGYDAEWHCIPASYAGAPQRRDRIFIVAFPQSKRWGQGRTGRLADCLTGLPIEPCWTGDPVTFFEERFAQPALLGVDDAIPGGLDRIGMCGNSIVPKIPELIGRAILAAEANA